MNTLGEALKYDHNHNDALELFNEALIKCSEHGMDLYEDFALQHKGKCLLELNRIEEAFVCFERALEIREMRSEEHTSELQSRGHLVCRLLLEKKNNKER